MLEEAVLHPGEGVEAGGGEAGLHLLEAGGRPGRLGPRARAADRRWLGLPHTLQGLGLGAGHAGELGVVVVVVHLHLATTTTINICISRIYITFKLHKNITNMS